jgi:hypothetical protein
MSVHKYVPSALVAKHMQQIYKSVPGTAHAVSVQLLLLPAFAADVAPDAQGEPVIELQQGVVIKVRRSRRFKLQGRSLASSQPVQDDWWLRGELLAVTAALSRCVASVLIVH